MSSTTPCPRCKDFLRFDVNRDGRVREVCPHCDEGRPHSRARWFERWALEERAKDNPLSEDKLCARCGKEIARTATLRTSFDKYCSSQCRSAFNNALKRARPKHPCATPGCTGTTRRTYCRPCSVNRLMPHRYVSNDR